MLPAIKPETTPVTADCGAAAKNTSGQMIATRRDEKTGPCDGCHFTRREQTFVLTDTNKNRNCIEGLAPVTRQS